MGLLLILLDIAKGVLFCNKGRKKVVSSEAMN